VTNAAGGLNQDYAVGDIVCLNDVRDRSSYSHFKLTLQENDTNVFKHLNMPGFVGINPLRGPNIEEFGVRFPPLSDAYDLVLRRQAHRAWKALGLLQGKRRLHEGVYAFLSGPT
jgi:purine-nucleoside phosphorylase